MKMLFHILKIHSGIDGVNPVFTTNYVVANPDYEKIKNNLYKKFEFNKFPIVPKRWERGELLNTVINGMNEGIWQPEYHGLVHIDPNAWLDLLIHNDNNTIKLFQVESYGGINSRNSEYNISQSKHVQTDIIRTGINIFNETFQYSPVSSISPYYRWDSRTEDILSKEGIKIIQAKNRQGGNDTVHDKLFGNILKFFNIKDTYHNKLIINGDRNVKYDLVYLNRNIDFEPQEYTNKDKIIINTINNITEKWNKNEVPIISSHRYNYVGFDSKACKENLFLLDRLLTEIENANPKVIYLTDMELGQVYQRGYSIRKFKNNIVIRNISEGKKYIAINLDGYAKIKNIHIYTLSENAACNIYSNNNYIEISEDTICKVIYE
jgi:hypothetical protein